MSQLTTPTSSKALKKGLTVRVTKGHEKRKELSSKLVKRKEFLLGNCPRTNGKMKSSALVSNKEHGRNDSDGSVQFTKSNLKNILAEKENFIETKGCKRSKQLKDNLVVRPAISSQKLPQTPKQPNPKAESANEADDILSGCTVSELLTLYENQFKILRGLQKNKANLVAFLKRIQLAKDEKLAELLENVAGNSSEIKNIQTIQVKFEKLIELKEKYLERELRRPFENILNKLATPKLLFPPQHSDGDNVEANSNNIYRIN